MSAIKKSIQILESANTALGALDVVNDLATGITGHSGLPASVLSAARSISAIVSAVRNGLDGSSADPQEVERLIQGLLGGVQGNDQHADEMRRAKFE